jgi:hypothetical protein
LCIFDTSKRCLQTINIYEDPIMHQIIDECIETKCTPKLKIKAAHRLNARYVSCLLDCYKEHVTNPSDATIMQNP